VTTAVTVGRSSSQPSGYTGHQMLDDVGLIHMNGRLYDPFLGRFCAADPFVQSPNKIQNYNRYTYVLNNPLSLVDPSGHIFGAIFGIFKVVFKAVATAFKWVAAGGLAKAIGGALVKVVASAAKLNAAAVKFTTKVLAKSAHWMKTVGSNLVTSIKATKIGQAAQNLVGWWGKQHAITQGSITNASWNGIQTARHGGSFSDILRSMARGAVNGAVGAVTGNVLAGLSGKFWLHMAAHGVAGGAMSAANGGSFKDGFVGSAVGVAVGAAFAGPSSQLGDLQNLTGVAARTTLAAVSGGVASKIMGGSFADGAYSAAFFHLFTKETQRPESCLGGGPWDHLVELTRQPSFLRHAFWSPTTYQNRFESYFPKRWPGWFNFAIQDFSAKVDRLAQHPGWMEPDDTIHSIMPNTTDGFTWSAANGPNGNETRFGDRPQTNAEASRFGMGAFFFELHNVQIHYTSNSSGQKAYWWTAEMRVGDGLGFDPEDLKPLWAMKLVPNRHGILARYSITGAGVVGR